MQNHETISDIMAARDLSSFGSPTSEILGQETYPSDLVLDTSIPIECTITFIATDSAGNIGTAQRVVNVSDSASAEATADEPNATTTSQGE